MDEPSKITNHPGSPPRKIGLKECHARLPAFLQIGTIVTPIVSIFAIFWMALAPSNDALYVSMTGIWTLALAYGWAFLYRRRFIHYVAAQGILAHCSQATDEMAFIAKIIYYSYEVDGRYCLGEYMVHDTSDLKIGDRIWVLYCATDPRKSVPWF